MKAGATDTDAPVFHLSVNEYRHQNTITWKLTDRPDTGGLT